METIEHILLAMMIYTIICLTILMFKQKAFHFIKINYMAFFMKRSIRKLSKKRNERAKDRLTMGSDGELIFTQCLKCGGKAKNLYNGLCSGCDTDLLKY